MYIYTRIESSTNQTLMKAVLFEYSHAPNLIILGYHSPPICCYLGFNPSVFYSPITTHHPHILKHIRYYPQIVKHKLVLGVGDLSDERRSFFLKKSSGGKSAAILTDGSHDL